MFTPVQLSYSYNRNIALRCDETNPARNLRAGFKFMSRLNFNAFGPDFLGFRDGDLQDPVGELGLDLAFLHH